MEAIFNLIVTTAFGLEAIARRELEALGYICEVVGPGRIRFSGDRAAICRANLWLRSADRVLIEVAKFPATDFDALFECTKAATWDQWIPADGNFPVVGRSVKSQLSSVPACQRAVKKAIVESLLAAHRVAALPETGAQYKVEIALLKNEATLTIDTTGPSLHKRGYRPSAAPAPLKETLAAALVQLSFWDRDRPLIDPFCGSGTIPIEAAMIGRNIAPGLNRKFAAEAWHNIAADTWDAARAAARDAMRPTLEERPAGTDIEPKALHAARRNAERAGVGEDVHFQQRAFAELSSKREHGCVITNPPYGERLGEQSDLEPLYQSMPAVLRKLPTWSHFILTAYPNFERLVGRRSERRRKLYNGRIACTYYQFHGPRRGGQPRSVDDESTATKSKVVSVDENAIPKNAAQPAQTQAAITPQPVFGGITDKGRQQAEIFHSRLVKRARHLRRWPTKQGITCYRLYDRDIPEVPLVVDRYEDHLHITEYERPHDRDAGQHADWLDLMASTAGKALDVDRRKVFVKHRERQRGSTQHGHLANRRYEITVGESGLKFLVNLSDYIDTGLFLDHRITRGMVRDDAQGKRVLNLFGYTGAFSIYAAAGGATETTTVDWSPVYLEWAEHNMKLNAFTGRQHQFVRADARAFIQKLPREPLFELAIIDPPTFSNSKRSDEDWEIQRDHAALLNELLKRIAPNGAIYFSSNFRRFKLDTDVVNSTKIHEISRQTVPDDFRNQRIHRCWKIIKES